MRLLSFLWLGVAALLKRQVEGEGGFSSRRWCFAFRPEYQTQPANKSLL